MNIIPTIAIMSAALLSQLGAAANAASDYDKKREAMIDVWKEMFGERIDFSNDAFFNNMSAVGAKALPDFKEMQSLSRKDWLRNTSTRWMKEFFQAEFRPRVEPEKYYLQKGAEPSVLYYQWRAGGLEFSMLESVSAVLVEIAGSDDKPFRPSQSELCSILADVLKLGMNQDQVAEAFQIKRHLEEGDIVTNAADLSSARRAYFDWRKGVIAFGSKKGLCILLLKAAPDRASPNLPNDPNWLKNGLTSLQGDK